VLPDHPAYPVADLLGPGGAVRGGHVDGERCWRLAWARPAGWPGPPRGSRRSCWSGGCDGRRLPSETSAGATGAPCRRCPDLCSGGRQICRADGGAVCRLQRGVAACRPGGGFRGRRDVRGEEAIAGPVVGKLVGQQWGFVAVGRGWLGVRREPVAGSVAVGMSPFSSAASSGWRGGWDCAAASARAAASASVSLLAPCSSSVDEALHLALQLGREARAGRRFGLGGASDSGLGAFRRCRGAMLAIGVKAGPGMMLFLVRMQTPADQQATCQASLAAITPRGRGRGTAWRRVRP
jgi:hypothetical protein